MAELKTGIGADTNLYTASDKARVERTLKFFFKYATDFPLLTTALAAAEEREAKLCEALEWYADMVRDRIFKESVK